MNPLKIEYVDIDSITPYVNNSRKHPQEQIDQIKASINEFGMCNPILIHNKTIVAGHGRFYALQQLGYKEIPTIDLPHLTDTQRKAYVIADNKISLNSTWDDDLLKIELESLYKDGLDLNLTGFDDFEIDELDVDFDLFDDGIERGGVGACDVDESKTDEIPETRKDTILKRGDVVEVGNMYKHRIMCGDSTNRSDVEKLMNGIKADMVFTDPDYSMSDDSWVEIMIDSIGIGVPIFIMASDKQQSRYVSIIPNFRKFFAGVRIQALMISQYVPMNKLTLVSYFGETPSKYFNNLRDAFSDVFEFKRHAKNNEEEEGHRHYKNVEIPSIFISHYSNEHDTILDVFGGSGTTLIACEKLGRSGYCMEIEESNAQLIIDRYVNYTGNKKVKINNEEVNWDSNIN